MCLIDYLTCIFILFLVPRIHYDNIRRTDLLKSSVVTYYVFFTNSVRIEVSEKQELGSLV